MKLFPVFTYTLLLRATLAFAAALPQDEELMKSLDRLAEKTKKIDFMIKEVRFRAESGEQKRLEELLKLKKEAMLMRRKILLEIKEKPRRRRRNVSKHQQYRRLMDKMISKMMRKISVKQREKW